MSLSLMKQRSVLHQKISYESKCPLVFKEKPYDGGSLSFCSNLDWESYVCFLMCLRYNYVNITIKYVASYNILI